MLDNRTYLFLTIIHATIMLWAMRFGIKRDRPVIVVVCATLLCMNVIMAPLSEVSLFFYDNNMKAMIKAQFLCLVSDAILVVVTLFDVSTRDKFQSRGLAPLPPELGGFRLPGVLWGGLFLTVLGIGSFVMRIIFWGGIEETWARTWDKEPTVTPYRGTLMLLSHVAVIYPYVVFYCHKKKLQMSRFHYVMGVLTLMGALGIFAVSGTTTGPLLAMIPIGLLMIRQNDVISWRRLIICGFLAMAFIWTFRLLRHIGHESAGGTTSVGSSAMGSFSDSELSVGNSMVMLHTFAMVIERIDRGDEMLWGRSYALVPLYFVPGEMIPWKNEFYLNYRPDSYTLDRLTSRNFMGLLPSGYYGEGYMNFGLFGLIGISVFIGAVIAFLDDRYRSTFMGLPGDLIIPVTIASLINSCRMYLADSMGMLITQVGLLVILSVVLDVFFRLMTPPTASRSTINRPSALLGSRRNPVGELT